LASRSAGRAPPACAKADVPVNDHFASVGKMIELAIAIAAPDACRVGGKVHQARTISINVCPIS
jgi:hypothetical protein